MEVRLKSKMARFTPSLFRISCLVSVKGASVGIHSTIHSDQHGWEQSFRSESAVVTRTRLMHQMVLWTPSLIAALGRDERKLYLPPRCMTDAGHGFSKAWRRRRCPSSPERRVGRRWRIKDGELGDLIVVLETPLGPLRRLSTTSVIYSMRAPAPTIEIIRCRQQEARDHRCRVHGRR